VFYRKQVNHPSSRPACKAARIFFPTLRYVPTLCAWLFRSSLLVFLTVFNNSYCSSLYFRKIFFNLPCSYVCQVINMTFACLLTRWIRKKHAVERTVPWDDETDFYWTTCYCHEHCHVLGQLKCHVPCLPMLLSTFLCLSLIFSTLILFSWHWLSDGYTYSVTAWLLSTIRPLYGLFIMHLQYTCLVLVDCVIYM